MGRRSRYSALPSIGARLGMRGVVSSEVNLLTCWTRPYCGPMLPAAIFAFLLCYTTARQLLDAAAQSLAAAPNRPSFGSSERLHALLQHAVESGSDLVVETPTDKNDNLDSSPESVKRAIYRRFGTWERLQQAALLQDWFQPAAVDRTTTSGGRSQKGDVEQPSLPILVEARELEHDHTKRNARPWDSQEAVLGRKRNIYQFWDDPICDVFLFPSGLRVCGDARIRGNLVVLSGMNLTEALNRDVGAAVPRSPHIRRRCTLDESGLRSRAATEAQPNNNSARRRPPAQLDDSGSKPSANNTTSPYDARPAQSSSWCFLKLSIRSADVYVLGSAEFGGSLYLRSARVDTGASLLVGLRGLLYSTERLTGLALSRNAQDFANQRLAADNEEDRSSNVPQTPSTMGTPTTRELYRSLAATKRARVPIFTGEGITAPADSRAQQFLLTRRAEQLYLTRLELESLLCPLLDLRGAPQFVVRRSSGVLEVVGKNEPLLRDLRRYIDQDSASSISAVSDYASQPVRSFGGMTDVNNFAPVYRQPSFFNSSRLVSPYSGDPVAPARPFGDLLAPLDFNTTLGDLVALSLITVDNAAAAWVFGNVVGDGIIVDAGSQFHTFCGQAYLNVSSGAGFTLLDASVVTIGGYLDSVAPRLVLQHGAAIAILGSVTITHFIQLLKSAVAEVFGSLLSFVTSVAVGSELVAHGSLKSELLLDISDGSVVRSNGSVELGSLQLDSRSSMRFTLLNAAALNEREPLGVPLRRSGRRDHSPQSESEPVDVPKSSEGSRAAEVSRHVVVIRHSLVINGASDVVIDEASLLAGEEIHLANHSRLLLQTGDVFVRNPGVVRVIGSTLQVGGSLLAPEGSVLIGFGSDVGIVGTLRCGGVTLKQAEKALARPLRRTKNANTTSTLSRGALEAQNVLTLSPVDGRIAAAATHRETGWPQRLKAAGYGDRRPGQRLLSPSSDSSSASLQSYSSKATRRDSPAATIASANRNKSGADSNIAGVAQTTNTANPAVERHHGNASSNSTDSDELEDLNLINPALRPRPALLVESSRLTIGGDIQVVNSWLDFTRFSNIVVGGSIVGLAPNSTLLRLRDRSSCKVLGGPVGGGMLVSLHDRSLLSVPNGSLVINGDLEVASRSILRVHSVQALGSIWVSQASTVVVADDVELSGDILAVSGWSSLQCFNVRQRKGDFFVEDGGSAVVAGGSVWVYGSLVAQDRASVRALEGHIVVIQGDVVAENYSHLSASKAILLYGAYRRNELFQKLSPVLQSAKESAVAIGSDQVEAETAQGTRAAAPKRSEQIESPLLIASTIRRTLESTVSTGLFIPQTLEVQVYFQALPDIFLRRAPNNPSSSPVSAELNHWATAAAKGAIGQRGMSDSNRTVESTVPSAVANNGRANGNFAPSAARISHGFNSSHTQAKLAGQETAIQELNNPSRWDSLVISRGALLPSAQTAKSGPVGNTTVLSRPNVSVRPSVPLQVIHSAQPRSAAAPPPVWPMMPTSPTSNAGGQRDAGVALNLLKMAAVASADLAETPRRARQSVT